MMTMMTIEESMNTLYLDGDVVEVFCFGKKVGDKKTTFVKRTKFGPDLARVWASAEASGLDCYIRLNPSALAPMTKVVKNGEATKDHQIVYRRRFLIDIDTRREKDAISTDEQFAHALAVGKAVIVWLEEYGLTGSTLATSGNGIHVLPYCELPNDRESENIIKRVLMAIQAKFENEHVKIDASLFNSGRLVRAYGTTNRKVEHLHPGKGRFGYIIGPGGTAPADCKSILLKIVAENPVECAEIVYRENDGTGGHETQAMMERELASWGRIDKNFRYTWAGRRDGYEIICPGAMGWADGSRHSQSGGSSFIYLQNGWVTFVCQHDHCGAGTTHGKKTIRHLRRHFDAMDGGFEVAE